MSEIGIPDVVQELAGMIPTVLGLIGFWWFTARDPIARSGESQLSLRRITRTIALASAATDVLWAITAALGELPPPLVVLSFALGVVEIVAAGHYACQLAKRIPRRRLIRQTSIATWRTALGAAMMAACFSIFDLFSDPPRVDNDTTNLLTIKVLDTRATHYLPSDGSSRRDKSARASTPSTAVGFAILAPIWAAPASISRTNSV